MSDNGNRRILIFDVHPDRFQSNPSAIAVLGQTDFVTREPRKPGSTRISSGSLSYDEKTQRLFIPDSGNNRILVYHVPPTGLRNFPEPVAVIGQPDFTTIEQDTLTYDPARARSKTSGPRIASDSLDSKNQLLYVSEGYFDGNRVAIFDISPQGLARNKGGFMADVIGHLDEEGNPSFTQRAANDRVDGRFIYPRAVTLDPVDHRLFTIDQYNHRVLVWRLDPFNRLLHRKAEVVIGQPDVYTANRHSPTARTFRIPGTVAYDVRHKRLFVGDGWYNRVLVFDADPSPLKDFPEAIAVLGQPDFTSAKSEMTRTSLNFDVAKGRHGITSGNPRAMGIAVDAAGKRLFVSDGPNYRVMVSDIAPDRLENGASAIAVLGKPDFTSGRSVLTEPRRAPFGLAASRPEKRAPATANQFDSMPGDLAFDPNHQRLFVIDGRSHRVLVFNVAPNVLKNGMDAIAVIGQPDFRSNSPVRLDTEKVSESTGRSRLRWPDGIAYDRKNDRLILTDKGNDRILVFDVAPERLTNGLEAIFVIGKRDFVSRDAGRGRQNELMDTRGIAFDSEHQRLYATDSFWGRLMVFDFARSSWDYRLPGAGTRIYSTIDASIKEDWSRRYGYTKLSSSASVVALGVYSVTQVQFDERSSRESRLLISETALALPPLVTSARVFVEQDSAHQSHFVLTNPGKEAAQVTFTFRDEQGALLSSPVSRTVAGGEQLRVTAGELLGRGRKPITGTASISSSKPLGLAVLGTIGNPRGEEILTAMPVSYGGSQIVRSSASEPAPIVVPKIVNGGGHRTRLILMNSGNSPLQGTIGFFTPSGTPMKPEKLSYSIPAQGTYLYQSDGASALARTGYAVVTSNSYGALKVAATVVLADGDTLISEWRSDVLGPSRKAWIPVNSNPTPIRHGEIRTALTIVNHNPVGVNLRFTLFGPDGSRVGRYEMILPEKEQRRLSLVQMFNVGQFQGALRLVSDAPVFVTAEQTTLNLRGESISMQVPISTEWDSPGNLLPYLVDGQGVATEVVLLNTGGTEFSGQMEIRTPKGTPLSLPLR